MSPETLVDERLQTIVDWLRANKTKLVLADKQKVVINLAGKKVSGEITISLPSLD
jgi:lipoate-protein ligase A